MVSERLLKQLWIHHGAASCPSTPSTCCSPANAASRRAHRTADLPRPGEASQVTAAAGPGLRQTELLRLSRILVLDHDSGVRAENPVRGPDPQSCSPSAPAAMITDHVPAVRVTPDYASGRVAAAVPA